MGYSRAGLWGLFIGCLRLFRVSDACAKGGDTGQGRKLMGEFRRRAVCLVSLDKNHIGLGGTGGIHRAILMNCAAQAALNAASEAAFSLPIGCSFYLESLRRTLCIRKGTQKFPGPRQKPRSRQAGCLLGGTSR